MDDRELSPILREVYQEAPETAEPSEWLWRRTRRSLRERGLLGSPARRSRFARVAAVAAAAALAGFLAGWVVGRTPEPEASSGTAVAEAELVEALERVQREGTDYARALEALAASLDRASGAEVATGQQVLVALTGAHSELLRAMAPMRPGALEELSSARAANRPAGHAENAPLIWF